MTQPNRWEHQGAEADPWSALSLIISGVLLWGAIGWAVSRWLHSPAYMGAGVLIGGVLGVLSVYLRYGRAQPGPPVTVGPVVLPGHSGDTTTARTPVTSAPPVSSTAEPTPSVTQASEEDTP
jgi:ATP synthase protein I